MSSVVLDVLESPRVTDGFAQSVSVLYVASEVADARVKDVVQRVLPQEQVADDAHAACVLVVDPEATQIGDSVDSFLHFQHLQKEVLEGHCGVGANLGHYVLVLLNETDDSLAVVLGDVFRFVFDLLLAVSLLFFFFFLKFLLLLAVLVLGDSLLMSDHPGFLVEAIEGELGEDGRVAELHHGAVLFLFLDDAVQHAVVVSHLIGVGK